MEKNEQVKENNTLDECKQALAESQKRVEEYTDHLKRLQAEFENYCKRVERERAEISARASERLIVKMLLIVDDFERALHQLKTVSPETRKGIELIFKNLHKVLGEEKVEPIVSVGKKVDPYKHEVMLHVEDNAPPETVLEELQKGYLMNGRVIRYAKVKVSKGPKNEKIVKLKQEENENGK